MGDTSEQPTEDTAGDLGQYITISDNYMSLGF